MASLTIEGPIGWFGDQDVALTGSQVRKALGEVPVDAKELRVLLNTPGGDAIEGAAICAYLEDWRRSDRGRRISVRAIEASSAGALILQTGDERLLYRMGIVMIHNSWAFMMFAGNADELQAYADSAVGMLRSVDDAQRQILLERWAGTAAELDKALAATTYFQGDAARDAGLVDRVLLRDEPITGALGGGDAADEEAEASDGEDGESAAPENLRHLYSLPRGLTHSSESEEAARGWVRRRNRSQKSVNEVLGASSDGAAVELALRDAVASLDALHAAATLSWHGTRQ